MMYNEITLVTISSIITGVAIVLIAKYIEIKG